jgi:hypothetical protein
LRKGYRVREQPSVQGTWQSSWKLPQTETWRHSTGYRTTLYQGLQIANPTPSKKSKSVSFSHSTKAHTLFSYILYCTLGARKSITLTCCCSVWRQNKNIQQRKASINQSLQKHKEEEKSPTDIRSATCVKKKSKGESLLTSNSLTTRTEDWNHCSAKDCCCCHCRQQM